MKLYTIRIRHCAPKDCKEAIVGYFIAENDSAIMEYINKELTFGIWQDRHDEDGPFEIRDEDYNLLGTESYKERMLRVRGEFNDPEADYSDAYYGVTHYGWDEGKDITEEEASVLIKLNMAVKLNQ